MYLSFVNEQPKVPFVTFEEVFEVCLEATEAVIAGERECFLAEVNDFHDIALEGVVDTLKEFWNKIKAAFIKAYNFVKNAIISVINKLKAKFDKNWALKQEAIINEIASGKRKIKQGTMITVPKTDLLPVISAYENDMKKGIADAEKKLEQYSRLIKDDGAQVSSGVNAKDTNNEAEDLFGELKNALDTSFGKVEKVMNDRVKRLATPSDAKNYLNSLKSSEPSITFLNELIKSTDKINNDAKQIIAEGDKKLADKSIEKDKSALKKAIKGLNMSIKFVNYISSMATRLTSVINTSFGLYRSAITTIVSAAGGSVEEAPKTEEKPKSDNTTSGVK